MISQEKLEADLATLPPEKKMELMLSTADGLRSELGHHRNSSTAAETLFAAFDTVEDHVRRWLGGTLTDTEQMIYPVYNDEGTDTSDHDAIYERAGGNEDVRVIGHILSTTLLYATSEQHVRAGRRHLPNPFDGPIGDFQLSEWLLRYQEFLSPEFQAKFDRIWAGKLRDLQV